MTWIGRTVIITGADSPVGVAVSCALSAAGASVVLAADGQGVAKLAAELLAMGGHAVAVPADVTDPVSMRRLVEQTLGAFGRLDAIVNLAHGRGTQAMIEGVRIHTVTTGQHDHPETIAKAVLDCLDPDMT